MTAVMVWSYEVRPGNGKWMARQFLNGVLLKSTWAETEKGAQALCKTWAAMHP